MSSFPPFLFVQDPHVNPHPSHVSMCPTLSNRSLTTVAARLLAILQHRRGYPLDQNFEAVFIMAYDGHPFQCFYDKSPLSGHPFQSGTYPTEFNHLETNLCSPRCLSLSEVRKLWRLRRTFFKVLKDKAGHCNA